MARTISRMHSSKRTQRSHAQTWNIASSTIADILGQAERPEQYCLEHAAKIDNFEFVSRSRRGINGFGKINLQEFYEDTILSLVASAERWCQEAESYMKANHPWNNQTGDAERGLSATVAGMENDSISMYLYHNIPLELHDNIEYGTILETYTYPKAGLLRIIQPTIQLYGPKLVAELQGVLNR